MTPRSLFLLLALCCYSTARASAALPPPNVTSFEAFWGGTIQLFTGSKTGMNTTQLDKTLSVTFPARSALDFTMSVHATNPTANICTSKAQKYSCAAYSGSTLTPGKVFESTFMTEMAPTITWAADAGRKYTVMLYDDNLKICHWMCVNVAGGSLAGATECYNLFMPANMSRSAWPTAYFPPGGPSTMALPYGFLLFEQSADITGAPASLLSHGVSAMVFQRLATSGDGNFNYSFPGLARRQNLTLRGSNWLMVKGNAYSGQMFKTFAGGAFSPFTANAMMYNCSTMADSYCKMPGMSTCTNIKKAYQDQKCCVNPMGAFKLPMQRRLSHGDSDIDADIAHENIIAQLEAGMKHFQRIGGLAKSKMLANNVMAMMKKHIGAGDVVV